MIQIEEITKKFAKIHQTIDDINNFSIRIRLIADSSPEEQDVATFNWQQKRFSQQEQERYQYEENCITDLEKEYHRQLLKEREQNCRKKSGSSTSTKNPSKKSILFSYVQKDGICPDDSKYQGKCRRNPRKPDEADKNNYLVNAIEKLTLKKQTDEEVVGKTKVSYDYFVFLNASITNPIEAISTSDNIFDSWESLHIMADFGEHYNSTWIPSEYILCTLKYNRRTKTLIANPDFTGFESFELKVTSDETKSYHYFIEIASPQTKTSRGSNNSRKRITEKTKGMTQYMWKKGMDLGRLLHDLHYVHVTLEIQKGSGFENNNVFVKWFVNLNGWNIKPSNETNKNEDVPAQLDLAGVTVSCRSSRYSKNDEKHDENVLHFGFPLEWHFLKDLEDVSHVKEPVVYFELISKDTWSRFRSEGVTQLAIPLQHPGRHRFSLNCCRTTSNGVANDLQRFFIGDSGNYDSLVLPVEAGMNRMATTTISTGHLQVSVNVLHIFGRKYDRSEPFENLREMRLREKLRDPQLTKDVANAVEAFKRARDAMIEARHAAIDGDVTQIMDAAHARV